MKLSEIKTHLKTVETVNFQLPDGSFVPKNFHVTEVGTVDKHFIDCGGKVRREKRINFQLWNANDIEHRLKPQKLINIITLSEKVLEMGDFEIEVEYQSTTIGKYGLDFNGKNFVLSIKKTDCLAKESCGIPEGKSKINLVEIETNQAPCCTPGSVCC